MIPCLFPAHEGDTRYVVGQHCTWSGPVQQAGRRREAADAEPRPCCPRCGDMLFELSSATEYEASLLSADRARPGVADVLRWGQGRCFPDFDTLENAYRQAMEGTF